MPARLLLLCLLFRGSWLTVVGDRHVGAAGVLHRRGGRAALAVRVGVAPGIPEGNRYSAQSGLLLCRRQPGPVGARSGCSLAAPRRPERHSETPGLGNLGLSHPYEAAAGRPLYCNGVEQEVCPMQDVADRDTDDQDGACRRRTDLASETTALASLAEASAWRFGLP